jgi:coatomer subunit beta'
MIHAERSNESLVEAFKNMHVHEEMVPDDNEDTVHEVILSSMIDSSQKKVVI